jgi:hypothetical protein
MRPCRTLVTPAHARTPRLKLANTSPASLWPIEVSRYSRRRGRPALEGSIDSHRLLNQPADSRRRRIGYKVPDAIPQRWCTSAPANCSAGFCKNTSSTRSVCRDSRTPVSFLPIVETLHRVCDKSKSTSGRESALALAGLPRLKSDAATRTHQERDHRADQEHNE